MGNEYLKFQIGYFINHDLWCQAVDLLICQIRSKKKNKHFNTLVINYYETILEDYNPIISKEEYFDNRISNNIFYDLGDEFFRYEYSRPKKNFGIRNYMFFSFPLRLIHYSIGIYLLKISKFFRDDYIKGNDNINSFYGGDLKLDNSDNNLKLRINSSDIYYRKQYQKYKKILKKENINSENKIVLKFDINNYFDNLPINKLLFFLKENIKDSFKKKLNFDDSTIELITFFYKFLMKSETGIPQANNDIISSFIGYLYLCFSDILITDEINKITRNKKIIQKYNIVRYMDDFYVILKFNSNIKKENINIISYRLASKIVELLYTEMNLKINNKTKIFNLSFNIDKTELSKDLKKVSRFQWYYDNNEDHRKKKNYFEDKINNIFKQLQELKELPSILELNNKKKILNTEIFKDIYNPEIRKIINIDKHKKKLKKIFNSFNFELIKFYPLPLILLILKTKSVKDKFLKYYMSKENLSFDDVYLLIIFISQTEYQYDKILDRLKNKGSKNIKKIISKVKNPNINIDKPGYYNLDFNKLNLIKSKVSIVKQIELRRINEIMNKYSIALNHLVNEIQSICYFSDQDYKKELKKYKFFKVKNFLETKDVPSQLCIQIKNLFDRRNNNAISHSNNEDAIFTGVSEKEYNKYKEIVGKVLGYIL